MERTWFWRAILVVGLTVFSIYGALPTLFYFAASPDVRRSKEQLKAAIPSWLPASRMNLGIDLAGGLHLVMGVDTEKALQIRSDRVADEIANELKEKGKQLKSARRPGLAPVIEIELNAADDWDTLKQIIDLRRDTWEVKNHSGASVTVAMRTEYARALQEDAIAQAQKTLRNRIDRYGVTEPEVRKSGQNSIIIQIAGLTADQESSVKEEILTRTAQLEFKIVDDESKYFVEVAGKGLPEDVKLVSDAYRGPGDALVSANYLSAKSKEALLAVVAANPPPSDRIVRYQKIGGATPTEQVWRTWLLDRKTPLTGDSLLSATVQFNPEEQQPYVAMKLDRRGAQIFDEMTSANIKKRMAIVLDDLVDSAPVIQTRIPEGNVSITLGGFKDHQQVLADAKALSIVLNAGALPAPVYPQEERTVGATLGEDAISKGREALLASVIFVVAFMVWYYKTSGVIAVVAMVNQIIMLIAALAAFGATLTLPGLAGLALTVGMAVDANIVQFERIREEMRLGKTVRAAIEAGFDRAFPAIFDAHLTTLLAAIVLYQYGSGPIRGFATTLGVGGVINIFTAVVVARLLMDVWNGSRPRTQELSI